MGNQLSFHDCGDLPLHFRQTLCTTYSLYACIGFIFSHSVRPTGEDQPLDKLRPCKVMGSSKMTTESLREKIVLLGIKAMEKFDGYY